MDSNRLNHRRDPFEAQLRRAVREMVGNLGVERVISLAIGVHSRADIEAGGWLAARLERIEDDGDRTAAFAAVARVALQAAVSEVLRQYEAGELPESQRAVVAAWVQDQG